MDSTNLADCVVLQYLLLGKKSTYKWIQVVQTYAVQGSIVITSDILDLWLPSSSFEGSDDFFLSNVPVSNKTF